MSVVRNKFNWIVLFAFLFFGCSQHSLGNDKVKAIQERIFVGMEAKKVVAILDELKIEHSGFIREERRIDAIVRNVESAEIVTTSMQFLLKFDTTNRLSSIKSYEVHTGP